MLSKLLVTVGIVFYAVVVPILEINDTHVFNQAWAPHARLHETWQLFTNTALGAFSVWLVWGRNDLRLASLLTLFVTGGFLLAYWLRDGYGGSMVLSDGSEKMIMGVNLGLLAYTLAIMLAGIAVAIDRRQRGVQSTAPHYRA
ncbi:hypothetical protein N5F23_00230 [Pseudomonas sichuanensis]|uniref:hypothetical protein n=1 Tax=Pseudomonas sichuanensis TaxID=2213015 RepID=UPI002448D3AE|nr:hypothetical protein [Pseudomonas sichuanensis]MDH0731005.1 hypothetical protein [Pseudomonas sichuanensis]MDH1581018.1 hypothetical protein [Pseudomonas sichuanensis]MDH1591121.1 hypothetical protein [Pseudomonas sichuanensis]MDH1596790.1 hypothetical protein [Pseudomonas sichuanensis]